MSVAKGGYLHHYVGVGLIGFGVGIAINAVPLFSAVTVLGPLGKVGEAVLLGLVSGFFGYISGGFVAGYLNFRLQKTEGGPMEGLRAGIMAFVVHFFITLFVFATFAAMSPGYTAGVGFPSSSIVMTGWVFTFVYGLIFYPIGGYLAGVLESRPIPMPDILAFQGAPAAPPPAPPSGAAVCPTCGGPLTYVEQYQKWYCYKCKKYA